MTLQVSYPHGLISKSSTYITSITRTPIEVGDSYPSCQFSCDTSSISSSWTNFHKYHKYTSWVGWQLGHSWQLDLRPDKLCLILPVCPDGQVYDAQMHMHPICFTCIYTQYTQYAIRNFPPISCLMFMMHRCICNMLHLFMWCKFLVHPYKVGIWWKHIWQQCILFPLLVLSKFGFADIYDNDTWLVVTEG